MPNVCALLVLKTHKTVELYMDYLAYTFTVLVILVYNTYTFFLHAIVQSCDHSSVVLDPSSVYFDVITPKAT